MTTQQHRAEVRTQAIGPAGIEACRKIVSERQFAKVNEVAVDLFSANAIVKVYDACKPEQRAKIEALPIARVASICMQMIS